MAAWEEKEYNLREVAADKAYTSLLKSIEIKKTDMSPDLIEKCKEKIINAVEKHMTETDANYDQASKMIKEDMEKDNGPTWVCIIGEAFAFNVKSQNELFLYCYLGNYGILLYKC